MEFGDLLPIAGGERRTSRNAAASTASKWREAMLKPEWWTLHVMYDFFFDGRGWIDVLLACYCNSMTLLSIM